MLVSAAAPEPTGRCRAGPAGSQSAAGAKSTPRSPSEDSQRKDAPISTPETDAHDEKVQAGRDKLQAQSEQKLAEMAGNPDLHRDASEAAEDADHRAGTAGS